ncbi:unnamed protein product [Musa acuminata var. zebrina]
MNGKCPKLLNISPTSHSASERTDNIFIFSTRYLSDPLRSWIRHAFSGSDPFRVLLYPQRHLSPNSLGGSAEQPNVQGRGSPSPLALLVTLLLFQAKSLPRLLFSHLLDTSRVSAAKL